MTVHQALVFLTTSSRSLAHDSASSAGIMNNFFKQALP
jgi:hypothetical protein